VIVRESCTRSNQACLLSFLLSFLLNFFFTPKACDKGQVRRNVNAVGQGVSNLASMGI
jgi:hypothetical protein